MSLVSIISAYRFVDIDDCATLRERLLAAAQQAALKGTVLLAPEGINLFLAGTPAAVQGWLQGLASDPRFRALEVKFSHARTVPFQRLRVKVKAEIIRMNQPTVRPAAQRAPALDAARLVRWLAAGKCDAGRELVMLDTRNGFEVDAGAFDGALDWRLKSFSDFPAALRAHRAERTRQGQRIRHHQALPPRGPSRCRRARRRRQQLPPRPSAVTA